MDDPLNQLPTIVSQTLGIDESDLHDHSDFRLDFNITPQEMHNLQTKLEETLDITLPDISDIDPFSYSDLKELIEDSII